MSNVPQAKPVYLDIKGKPAPAPPEHFDSHSETKWQNPTDKVVTINLFVGTPVPGGPGRPPKNYEEKWGLRRYVWQPGEVKSISSEFDWGIQSTHCKETECLPAPFACRDPEHIKEIVGGLAPQLENLGVINRPTLAKALDDEQARLNEAERKEYEAFKRQQMAMQEAARARAEAEIAQQQIDARAKAEAESRAARGTAELDAATAPQQPPKKK